MNKHSNQKGQTLIAFSLVFMFLLLGMLALVGNLNIAYTYYETYDNATLLAAQAGAAQVDSSQLPSFVLDQSAAKAICFNIASQVSKLSLSDPNSGIICTTTATTVTATISHGSPLAVPLWGNSPIQIHRSHSATLSVGQTQGE
jgi:hypothetical protein